MAYDQEAVRYGECLEQLNAVPVGLTGYCRTSTHRSFESSGNSRRTARPTARSSSRVCVAKCDQKQRLIWFAAVVGLRGLDVPVPAEPTTISCTLNNGIHFVTTPDSLLARDCPIDQEFELCVSLLFIPQNPIDERISTELSTASSSSH